MNKSFISWSVIVLFMFGILIGLITSIKGGVPEAAVSIIVLAVLAFPNAYKHFKELSGKGGAK